MIVVVPPQAAARVPVSNVSDAVVPPNGSSMCVWTSMPPGITYLPGGVDAPSAVARPTRPSAEPGGTSAAIVSPSTSDVHRGGAGRAMTTVPPVISDGHGVVLRVSAQASVSEPYIDGRRSR